MSQNAVLSLASTLLLWMGAAEVASANDVPRRPDGRPDLSGNYDIARLTPMQRKPEFGDRRFLTKEEAEEIEHAAAAWRGAREAQRSEPRGPAAAATSAATTRSGSTAARQRPWSTASTGPRSSSIRPTVACRR